MNNFDFQKTGQNHCVHAAGAEKRCPNVSAPHGLSFPPPFLYLILSGRPLDHHLLMGGGALLHPSES
jgi:hypothetical protein